MLIEDFIINVYCLVNANSAKVTQGKPIRRRGEIAVMQFDDIQGS